MNDVLPEDAENIMRKICEQQFLIKSRNKKTRNKLNPERNI